MLYSAAAHTSTCTRVRALMCLLCPAGTDCTLTRTVLHNSSTMILSFKLIAMMFATVAALGRASEEGAGEAGDVVVLTAQNFDTETKTGAGSATGDWLIEFYAPWCGHCKRLQPVWEELATDLKGTVNVAKVDVTANRPLGSRFDIKGFPTIKFLHDGKVYSYQGRRTKEDFTAFVKGGYVETTGTDIPPMPTWIDEMTKSVTGPFKAAYKDISKGKYVTPNVFIVAMPILVLVVITFAMLILPEPEVTPESIRSTRPRKRRIRQIK